MYFELRILGSHSVVGFAALVVAATLTGAFAFFGLDINQTGPHRLYRDKLARAFIEHGAGDHSPRSATSMSQEAHPIT